MANEHNIAYQDQYHLQSRGSCPRWWVAQLPGDGGKDWGWTTKREEAIDIPPYWQKRFLADARHCGWKSYGIMPRGGEGVR
jgi:hypothetical protein